MGRDHVDYGRGTWILRAHKPQTVAFGRQNSGGWLYLKTNNGLQVEPWEHTRDETNAKTRPSTLSKIVGEDPIDSEIIGAIANLSNHIKEGQAIKDLNK